MPINPLSHTTDVVHVGLNDSNSFGRFNQRVKMQREKPPPQKTNPPTHNKTTINMTLLNYNNNMQSQQFELIFIHWFCLCR